jgi:hypothetical protein
MTVKAMCQYCGGGLGAIAIPIFGSLKQKRVK